MRVDTRPRKRNAPRIAEKHCPAFLQWLRGRPCIFSLAGACEGKIEAAHLDFAGGKGVGTKVADQYAVPMCVKHHRAQHTMGWNSFLKLCGNSKETLLDCARAYWRQWPGRIAWERKLSDG